MHYPTWASYNPMREVLLFLPFQRTKLRCLDIQAFARGTSSGGRPSPPARVLHVHRATPGCPKSKKRGRGVADKPCNQNSLSCFLPQTKQLPPCPAPEGTPVNSLCAWTTLKGRILGPSPTLACGTQGPVSDTPSEGLRRTDSEEDFHRLASKGP